MLDPLVAIRKLLVEGPMRASSGATTERKRLGRGRRWTRWIQFSGLPEGTRSPC
jgi:hypothetical protein